MKRTAALVLGSALAAGGSLTLNAGGRLETFDITANLPSPIAGHILGRVIGIRRKAGNPGSLVVTADWSLLTHDAEWAVARRLLERGYVYRGLKPVNWCFDCGSALAEAEVEYQDYQSDTIWVKFKVIQDTAWGEEQQLRRADQACLRSELVGASVVIWTTTPWTIPGNRAVSYSAKLGYGLYEVTKAPDGNWAKAGDRYIVADKLAAEVMKAAKVEAYERREAVSADELGRIVCAHPLRDLGYGFDVPLLDGDHVTDDTGTGFVHTAPGHGADDYVIWTASQKMLRERSIDTTIPFTVDADGVLTAAAPGFTGKRVLKENGDKPKPEDGANDAVVKALVDAGALIARGRLKHQYPHSWRSKKPVIFRNTPQWFIAMDEPLGGPVATSDSPPPRGEGLGVGGTSVRSAATARSGSSITMLSVSSSSRSSEARSCVRSTSATFRTMCFWRNCRAERLTATRFSSRPCACHTTDCRQASRSTNSPISRMMPVSSAIARSVGPSMVIWLES